MVKKHYKIGISKSLFIIITALLFLFPFYWMFVTALKTQGHVYVTPPEWIPHSVRLKKIGRAHV